MKEQNAAMNVMADNAMLPKLLTTNEPAKLVHGVFPYRDDAFEAQYASFSAAIEQLKKVAGTLDGFNLQVSLKWKRNPDKLTPQPDFIKFPELPRYVSEDVAVMVTREETKQRKAALTTQESEDKPTQQVLLADLGLRSVLKAGSNVEPVDASDLTAARTESVDNNRFLSPRDELEAMRKTGLLLNESEREKERARQEVTKNLFARMNEARARKEQRECRRLFGSGNKSAFFR